MRLRQTIADNLKTLMAASKLDTLPKITAASRDRLTNGTLDRIRRGIGDARIDKLEELADVFRVDPWVLTVPGITAQQGLDGFPVIRVSTSLIHGSGGKANEPLSRQTDLEPPDKKISQGELAELAESLAVTGRGQDARSTNERVQKPRRG